MERFVDLYHFCWTINRYGSYNYLTRPYTNQLKSDYYGAVLKVQVL